jgi:hypothetical protein
MPCVQTPVRGNLKKKKKVFKSSGGGILYRAKAFVINFALIFFDFLFTKWPTHASFYR